jgi:hypothetical protein
MHDAQNLSEVGDGVDPAVHHQRETVGLNFESFQPSNEFVEHSGEDSRIALIPGVGLGEDGDRTGGDQTEPGDVLVVSSFLGVTFLGEPSGLVVGEEIGGIKEEPPGVDSLSEEVAEHLLLDTVGYRPGKNGLAPLSLSAGVKEPSKGTAECLRRNILRKVPDPREG